MRDGSDPAVIAGNDITARNRYISGLLCPEKPLPIKRGARQAALPGHLIPLIDKRVRR